MYILLSILAGIGFGASLFIRKLSVGRIGMPAFILEVITELILATILILILFPSNYSEVISNHKGVFLSIAAGISITIGLMSFFLAARMGPVLTPSVLGPIIAALTASLLAILILRESASPIKILGLIIALVGLFIFIKY